MNKNLDIAKAANGMIIIGSLMFETEKNISAIPFVLAGDMDDELKRGFFASKFGIIAEYDSSRACPELEGLKQHLRFFVQAIFRAAAHEEEMERRVALEKVRYELKDSNKPHEMGTVSEIAARLGISKSEVRRRKADGTLEELFHKQLT